jgi:hypothetical protein
MLAVLLPSDHEYVYGGVPPLSLAARLRAVPIQMVCDEEGLIKSGGGSATLMVTTLEHPFASVMVQV